MKVTFKNQMRSLFTARTWVRSANAWEIARVNIGQILKIRMTASPLITQKRQNSLPHPKSKRFPVLTVFPIISDFKAHFIFHVRNTNPLALSVHAVNYASHIKRGFISSAFIYPIIYHKAPCRRETPICLQRIDPGEGAELHEIQSKIQVWNLPFSLGMAAERKNTKRTSSAGEQEGEGRN